MLHPLSFQVKNHLCVFVNCLIENPTFDSQTKENMTLQQKTFGSTCPLSDKFIKQVPTRNHSPRVFILQRNRSPMSQPPACFLFPAGHILRGCGEHHELGEVQGSDPTKQEMLNR